MFANPIPTKPLYKKLSCSITSMNNLKKHVKSSQPTFVKKLQNAIDDQKRKHTARRSCPNSC